MNTSTRHIPEGQDGALGGGDEKANSCDPVQQDLNVKELIRHVNGSERYSFEAVCKSISEAVGKAKSKAKA